MDTVTFVTGSMDEAEQCFQVEIVDDNILEGPEEVVLSISSADVALPNSTITLSIADKDMEGIAILVFSQAGR